MCDKKDRIKRAFNRSAKYYDHNCLLQFSVATNLIDLIKIKKNTFDSVIDVGCGTGLVTQYLKSKIVCNQLFALDISDESLRLASVRLNGDILIESSFENIPLVDESVDLVFSNMSFHWSGDLMKTIQESYRILKPGGLLAFSIPSKETFKEIRLSIEKLGVPNFLNDFIESSDLRDMLNNFRIIDVVNVNYTFYYRSIYALIKSIKNMGANQILHNAHRRSSKADFEKLDNSYPDRKIPLNYEILCCLAVKQ